MEDIMEMMEVTMQTLVVCENQIHLNVLPPKIPKDV